MSTSPFNEILTISGGLIQISPKEELIRQRLEDERRRLEKEAGLEKRPSQHFHKPIENPFTKSQRDRTTILFGGLTWKHEKLIHGTLESLGYKCEALPVPNKKAFQLGKEYGNNGQCNPTYFTVGNLVEYVQSLEEKGMSKQEIIDRYVFFTAGACGPCRFGMYEAEYRLALRNSGFDGLRVLLFQQSGGLNQAEAEAGLEMNLDFFLGILNAMNIGDIINDVAYQIRPYEVNPGETDRVLDACMDLLQEVIRKKQPWTLEGKLASLLGKTGFAGTAEYVGKFLNQLYGDDFKREYHRLIDALGGIAHHLTDQYELQRLGHPFYNSRAGGGEGHLEVAKNIYYSNKDLCHMVLSLKPFGCMPSTQSDGAQSAVVSTYKDMIFIPIETSGEGDVNAHSRVQMALGEAKVRAKNEMKRVVDEAGVTLEDVRAFVAEHRERKVQSAALLTLVCPPRWVSRTCTTVIPLNKSLALALRRAAAYACHSERV